MAVALLSHQAMQKEYGFLLHQIRLYPKTIEDGFGILTGIEFVMKEYA